MLLVPARPAVAVVVDTKKLNHGAHYVHHKQYHKAYAHYRRMAEKGCAYSQCIVGLMHKHGVGTKKDDHEAFLWFEKSASQGFADAKRWLGHAYAEGQGVMKNLDLARRNLAEAAEHGINEAKYELAVLENRIANSGDGGGAALSVGNYESNDNAYSAGLKDLTKSWGGYVSVTKSIQGEINSTPQ